MLDGFLIRHSAPTLAGLKTASLFWYPWESREELNHAVNSWQEIFREKGLRLVVLRVHRQRALLYLYRVKNLEQDLSRQKTRAMLAKEGYFYETAEQAISILKKRIQESRDFPHEVGLFLGYPQEDVQGFIENQGKNCKYCGCWKVYCNECDAKKAFCRFKKCAAVYEKMFLNGKPVRQLIVAA